MTLPWRHRWQLCLQGRASCPHRSSTYSTKINILPCAVISFFTGYLDAHFLRKLPSAIHLSVTGVQSWRFTCYSPLRSPSRMINQRQDAMTQIPVAILLRNQSQPVWPKKMLTNMSTYSFASFVGVVILNTQIIKITVSKHSSLPPKSLTFVKAQFWTT